jgi:hypothetical protein
VSFDEEADKISINTIICKVHEAKGIDARKVCDYCIQQLGSGKGGGKVDLASASLPTSGSISVNHVLQVAQAYWNDTLL